MSKMNIHTIRNSEEGQMKNEESYEKMRKT